MKTLFDFPDNRLMTDEEVQSFVILFMAEANKQMAPADIPMPTPCQILDKHLGRYGVGATIQLLLAVALITDGVPGRMVMWAWTLVRHAQQNGRNHYDMSYVFQSLMPDGVPTDTTYNTLWVELQNARFQTLDWCAPVAA